MPHIKFAIPSPTTVISVVALFIALGGTGYAATQLGSPGHTGTTVVWGPIKVAKPASGTTRKRLITMPGGFTLIGLCPSTPNFEGLDMRVAKAGSYVETEDNSSGQPTTVNHQLLTDIGDFNDYDSPHQEMAPSGTTVISHEYAVSPGSFKHDSSHCYYFGTYVVVHK